MHTMSKIAGIAAAAITAGVLIAPTAGAVTPNAIPNTGPETPSSTFYYPDGSSFTIDGATPLGTDGDVAIGTSALTPEICGPNNAICYKSRTPSKDGGGEK